MNQASSLPRSDHAPLKCQWEPFSGVSHELLSLSRRQQAEVGEGYQPYSPDWQQYYKMERAGSCAVWTAREFNSGVLVGYIIWLTVRGLHAVETTFAHADLCYLAPEWRSGLRGYRFVKSGIAAIKATKPDIVRFETNDLYEGGRVGLLLKRLGFKHIGSVWQQ